MKIIAGSKLHEVDEVNNYRELLQRTVSKYPDKIAYKFKNKRSETDFDYVNKTYSEFDKEIKEFSTALLEKELQGKRVALIGDNSYRWCVSYLSITMGDMVVVPLDKSLPENEMESLIIRSEAEAIVFDSKYADIMLRIKNEGKSNLKYLISMNEVEKEEIILHEELIQKGKALLESGNTIYENIKMDNDKMSVMLFTSGTTALPKAVMLSQANVCSSVKGTASYVKMYETDTLLSFLPIHHTFECSVTFLYGIYYGVTVAFCDGLKYIVQNLKEYEVTIFVAVPLVLETMYKKILKGIEDKGKTKLINKMMKISNGLLKLKIDIRKKVFKQILDNFGGKLRLVFYGAAPMNKDTIIGFNSFGIDLLQGYGLTETSPVIACETNKEVRPGSVGKLLYHTEARIDEPNEEGVGELVVKAPTVMLGYYNNQEETDKVLKDGWFRTGDYAYFDKDEFLYITGRKKDVIVLKNGKNIYPQEIEFLINKIPYITESIVYAREKDSTDTVLGAKIVYDVELIKSSLGELSEEEYKEKIWEEVKEINKNLSIDKKVKQIEVTTEPFKKTTTQKVKRFEELKTIKN